MTYKEIQGLLDSGLSLGVRKALDSPDYLGWILLSKHRLNPRLKEILDESEPEHAHRLEKERRRELAPYLILDIELSRSVHEAGGYETEDDYRKKVATWCRDLEHVETVLKELGVELHQLRESRELDAP
jgi:hypothetical protein